MSVAIGLTPEMLPMVGHLHPRQGRGADVAAQGHRQAASMHPELRRDGRALHRQDRHAHQDHHRPGATDIDGRTIRVPEYAYLNSHYQTGLKNLLDVAVLENGRCELGKSIQTTFPKVDEIPFDFQRRRMSVVVARQDGGDPQHLLICRAPSRKCWPPAARCAGRRATDDARAARPTSARRPTPSTPTACAWWAVGMKALPPRQDRCSVADEAGLTLPGFVAFPRPAQGPPPRRWPACAQRRHRQGPHRRQRARHRKICRDVRLDVAGTLLGSRRSKWLTRALAQAVVRPPSSPSSRR